MPLKSKCTSFEAYLKLSCIALIAVDSTVIYFIDKLINPDECDVMFSKLLSLK